MVNPEGGVRRVTERVMVDVNFGATTVAYSPAAKLQWQQWMDRVNRHRDELPDGAAPAESILAWVVESPEIFGSGIVMPKKARPGLFATWDHGQSILVYDRHWGSTRHVLLRNADVTSRIVELDYQGAGPALTLTLPGDDGRTVAVGLRTTDPSVVLDRFNADLHVKRMHDLITAGA